MWILIKRLVTFHYAIQILTQISGRVCWANITLSRKKKKKKKDLVDMMLSNILCDLHFS